jgi:hypothetical protein
MLGPKARRRLKRSKTGISGVRIGAASIVRDGIRRQRHAVAGTSAAAFAEHEGQDWEDHLPPLALRHFDKERVNGA